ncbi:MAG: TlyA family rRNA (cytidine-2'-O)-methyltransferase [bacterium]|nr:MAG: TlyA family rRNA (cytidine-2'-O)-methyltransferase [bacterium]
MGKKKRLDSILFERGIAESRERAKSLILAGRVFTGGARLDKAGAMIDLLAEIEVKGPDHPYVSRGGVKLDALLEKFHINVNGKKALDVGASTGGFTDCMLQRGAESVTAIDVGRGQIGWKIRSDQRVRLIEGLNARGVTPENAGGPYDVVTIDVSFISLTLILGPVVNVTAPGGVVAALVKPQFEAGREEVGKGGIVRDPKTHKRVVEKVRRFGATVGLDPVGEMESPIKGAKGNKEFFIVFRRRR